MTARRLSQASKAIWSVIFFIYSWLWCSTRAADRFANRWITPTDDPFREKTRRRSAIRPSILSYPLLQSIKRIVWGHTRPAPVCAENRSHERSWFHLKCQRRLWSYDYCRGKGLPMWRERNLWGTCLYVEFNRGRGWLASWRRSNRN